MSVGPGLNDVHRAVLVTLSVATNSRVIWIEADGVKERGNSSKIVPSKVSESVCCVRVTELLLVMV